LFFLLEGAVVAPTGTGNPEKRGKTMTHQYAALLAKAGVTAHTENFGPMDGALLVAPLMSGPVGPEITTLMIEVALNEWAEFAPNPRTQMFVFEPRDGHTVPVSVTLFDDARHGLVAALAFQRPQSRTVIALEYWPVANREAPIVQVWEIKA
jgi:hypothetical protein